MTNKFKQGDTVWMFDGRECEYVAKIGEWQHAVLPVDEDGDEFAEERSEVVSRVYAEPPVVRAQAKLDELRAQAAEAQEALRVARDEQEAIRREAREYQALREKLAKQHHALSRLDALLTSPPEWVVLTSGTCPRVATAAERFADRRANKVLALHLYGYGRMEWVADAGGIEFFDTKDEAMVRASALASMAVCGQDVLHWAREISDMAGERGLLLTDEAKAHVQALRRQARVASVESARKRLAEAEASMAALDAEAADDA